MTEPRHPPVLGIAAWSGTGKTTLLRRVIPLLRGCGIRLALVKHAHHRLEVDHPGKDSFELRQAGAAQVLIASQRRWALLVETPERDAAPALTDLLPRLDTTEVDLVLVEGFKHAPIPKIELQRPALGRPLLYPTDPCVIAVAADAPLQPPPPTPVLDLNDPPQVAEFILAYLRRQRP